MTEHSTAPAELGAYRDQFRKRDWSVELTGLDPAYAHPVGGVAIAAKQPTEAVELEPRTREFANYRRMGRAMLSAITVGEAAMYNITLYGWPLADR